MLHLVYIFAFTIISFFAISNLIRSLINVSYDSQRSKTWHNQNSNRKNFSQLATVSHPELLDNNGQPIKEPLLVMRSVSVEDARQQLDQIYNSSPGVTKEEEQ